MHTSFCFYWRAFSLVHVCKAAFALPCLPSWSGPLGGAEFLQDRYSRKCWRWRDDDDDDVWWMMCDVWWWMMCDVWWWMMCDVWWWMMTCNRDWNMFLGPLFTARRFWFPWFRQPWVSPSVVARRMIQTDQHSKRITWPFTSTSAAPKRALKLDHWKSVFFQETWGMPWQILCCWKEWTCQVLAISYTAAGCLWHQIKVIIMCIQVFPSSPKVLQESDEFQILWCGICWRAGWPRQGCCVES